MHRSTRRLFAFLIVPALCAGALVISLARAAEDRPAAPPVAIEDPPPADPPVGREGKIIVAVIDTGVDADHPALKGRVLPAINLSGAGGGNGDEAGHGTAIAGLICAQDDNPGYDGVCAALDDVRILPIKVTPGSDSRTLPSRVAAGIDRAVDEGARVICVALGGPRSSEGLEAAMAKAEKHGVLVIAAAGVDGGFHDLYPAAHPWAVSCTTMDTAAYEDDEGKFVTTSVIASRANRSGKTSLMGAGYAKVLAPGGGYHTLQGSSVPCGKAAGWAAWLVFKSPESRAPILRGLLTGSGPALAHPNRYLRTETRKLLPESLRLAVGLDPATQADLCLDLAEWKPLAAEGRTSIVAQVRNLAGVEVPCRLRVKIPAIKRVDEGAEVRIPAGESRMLTVEFATIEGKGRICEVEAHAAQDPNPHNNMLFTESLPTEADLSPGLWRVSAARALADGKSVELRFLVSNPAPLEWKGVLNLSTPESDHKEDLNLKPHESRWVRRSLDLPAVPEGKRAIEIGIRLEDSAGKEQDQVLIAQFVEPAGVRTQ